MKNAKVFFALSLCTALFLLASCKSATPLQRDGIVDIPLTLSNYEVLSRVKFEGTRFLFFHLLNKKGCSFDEVHP